MDRPATPASTLPSEHAPRIPKLNIDFRRAICKRRPNIERLKTESLNGRLAVQQGTVPE
jgi:hypothetical protein